MLITVVSMPILALCFDIQGDWDSFFWFVLSLLLGLIYVTIRFKRLKRQPHYQKDPHISPQMLKHYQDANMSDDEIDFFRQTMQQAETQIKILANNMQALPKLRAIDLNHDTTKVSQLLFRAIVKEPKRLHNAGDFLYRHLPSINELTSKYIEINHHEVKTADTYLVLDKSAAAIDALSQQIQQDYADFVAEDVADLDTEIAVARHQITPDSKEED
ncbi:5-bromo-4-chloroindolyl phosphate hydrolysis family protein [Latilactobacillus graminis DSM 20719]|uniref:5-bromo-4-chloroindolyl phosphate hydrolysis family protein n=2 Tax=Latilactobacillus graminis TaxID=60519 RepID=A0AA89I2U9_9LACO|nr:5-bromo-4-chloroindolyl phosphate hydrolysis family protein [Latilactobacillus graminis DSM 20719]